MSVSPFAQPLAQRATGTVSRVSVLADSIALVVNTRAHYPLALIPALVRHGFTSAERPSREAMTFVAHLRPGLVVAIVDPRVPEDVHLIRMAARSGAYVLLLAESPESFAPGLEAGADVCLTDDTAVDALEAQIGAIRRRLDASLEVAKPDLELVVGDFRLDSSSRRLHKGETQIPLTAMEFSILAHLVENRGKTTSAQELLHHVTGRVHRDVEASQTVKVYIRRLRQKLQAYGASPNIITTVRGYGYMVERQLPGN